MSKAVALILLALNLIVYSAVYHVAQDGSGDFTNVQAAADVLVAGDSCYIHNGVYREMVTPKNSGAAGKPIVFIGYGNDMPVITGTEILTGWSQHEGSIYKAAMPNSLGQGNDMIFVDGKAVHQARFPNGNQFYHQILNNAGLSPL